MLNILLVATALTFFYQLSLRLKSRAETTVIPLTSESSAGVGLSVTLSLLLYPAQNWL